MALGASLLHAQPAQALDPTWLVVGTSDPLLNENGDGYWESATIDVGTDADTAHWVLTTAAGQVVAEADLTAEQLSLAQHGAGTISVSSATVGKVLAAGTYTVTVTATSTGEEPTTRSTTIHVSTAPRLAAPTRSASTFYPRDTLPGVAHAVTLRQGGLDATISELATPRIEIVGPDGHVVGPWNVDHDNPTLRWNGEEWDVLQPAGTYRARLAVHDGNQTVYGPLSQPFTLSWGYRVQVTSTATRTANATRTATLTQRQARVRVVDGSLRYRAYNTDWRRQPLVRTAHRVTLPRDRAPGYWPVLVVRGPRQYDIDLDLEMVTREGDVRNIDVFTRVDTRSMIYPIPGRFIRSDGTVRFRLLWSSYGPTGTAGRVGRTDTISIQSVRYVWRGL
ncbi:hypothetical protein CFH99_06220 [Nocardioides aromaticivorans]|uniref:Uncharacterized protein n=1 Tax=Nocardioides aromaticivorans TaxID=200618 RepID=A0ABX7PHE0_9ACTN|nr:hypothetical protein CFH99_06220 [Nocardioides aromaticivorans]